ncbi:MAG: ABC-F family ATP-binding cassette domain-containing protein [Lachnospiraceae bacterium]|nr:ABC-F family ATP-binding cassette domain-containing protein [Lachnospiraceae bacterium]
MNLLTIKNFSKSITDKVLFNDTDFSINEGEKIGVIGVNGTGKSTLLKIISGIMDTDKGEVVKSNKVKINYLSQNPEFEPGITIYDYVISKNMNEHNQWNVEGEAKNILNILGFGDYNLQVDKLSGGQRKRVALAATLLSDCDILILDEPTNHLDSYMSAWLEDYLKKSKAALVMVTHDRYFLDRVCNVIVEIDGGKVYRYIGGYEKFLEEKTLREEIAIASERKRQSILRVELEWIRRGARARSTKQKAHIQRYEALRDMEGPKEAEKLSMSSISSRLGNKTIELSNISKSFDGRSIIKDFNYIFLANDRIGIVGENGCGKSTLMKIIMGEITTDSGSVEIGQTVKIGYFSQENEHLPQNMKVIDYIKDTAEFVQTVDGVISASKMLERFLFDSTLQYQMINRLSGGEKRRLYLLKILMEAPNVLILDEPTNDLDISTMMILEDYLDSFAGIVISVSHDRYFLNRMANRIFAYERTGILDGTVINQYEGNYDDYMSKSPYYEEGMKLRKGENKKNDSSDFDKKEKTVNVKPKSTKLKMTYKEMREFETIDDDIADLEEKIENLEKQITLNATDFIKLNEFTKEKEETEKLLEEKMERWVYLNDLNEKINSQ